MGSKLRDSVRYIRVAIYIFGQRTWKLYDNVLVVIYGVFGSDMQ